MSSVGYAHAVLKGRLSGDIQKARKFLGGLGLSEERTRNRIESRARGKLKKRAYKLGERTRIMRRHGTRSTRG